LLVAAAAGVARPVVAAPAMKASATLASKALRSQALWYTAGLTVIELTMVAEASCWL
jgi:hypothetical protein